VETEPEEEPPPYPGPGALGKKGTPNFTEYPFFTAYRHTRIELTNN